MIKTNKIIRKRQLPGFIAIGLGTVLTAGLAVYSIDEEMGEKYKAPQDKVFNAVSLSVVWLLGMSMLLLVIFEVYKENYAFASHTAREFLKQEMKEHPEFKTFEKVLSNPKALRSVATMISNSLHDSEQKQVMNIVDEMAEKLPGASVQDKVNITKHAHADIIKIIQEHVAVHPEFLNEVLAAMAYADTTYVIPVQQHTK